MLWKVWIEGFLVTGMEGVPQTAKLINEIEAPDWDTAVQQAFILAEDPSLLRKNKDGSWSYWGCRIYNNEEDAKKFLG